MKKLVYILIFLLILLHQDFWWWDDIEPLVFGFLPIGLAYHVFLSLAAACVWALAVRYCWPADAGVGETSRPVSSPRHREL